MARAHPESFRDEGGGGPLTRLPSLIAAALMLVALLTNAAAQPDCKTIDDFSRAKVGEFPADWKPRKDSGKDAYRVTEEPGLRFLRAVVSLPPVWVRDRDRLYAALRVATRSHAAA